MWRRFACVRAVAEKDCGPAALATVLRHYGSRVSLVRLHDWLHTDRQGTDLKSLRDGAERLGFEVACGVLKAEALDRIALPFIAHFNEAGGHFVTVHQAAPATIVIADPARGIVSLARAEFMRRWSGQALLLRPSPQFTPRFRQSRPFVELVRVALRERRLLWVSVWLAAVAALLSYGMSFFIRFVVDRAIPDADHQLLLRLGIGISVVVAIRTIVGVLRQYVLAHVGLKLGLSLGLDYVRHLIWLPVTFFDTRQSGETFARFIDAPKVTSAIAGPLLTVVLDGALLALCGIFLLWYSTSLSLITFGFVLTSVLVTLGTTPVAKRKEREIHERFSQLANRFVETVNNIRIIKTYTDEDGAYDRIAHHYSEVQASSLARARLSVVVNAAAGLLTGAASIWLLWAGARLTIEAA